jgi:hypothetical protein
MEGSLLCHSEPGLQERNLALVGKQFEIARSARNERADLRALEVGAAVRASLYVVDSKGLTRTLAVPSAYGEPQNYEIHDRNQWGDGNEESSMENS